MKKSLRIYFVFAISPAAKMATLHSKHLDGHACQHSIRRRFKQMPDPYNFFAVCY